MKIKTLIKYFTLLTLLVWTVPVSTHAAKIFVDHPQKNIGVGDTVLLKIMLDTEGQEINVAEGVVRVHNPADVSTINTGGSIFDLWTRKPSLVDERISFTGGTTAGVYGTSLKLFTIAIKPSSETPINLDFEDVTIFLNDGKGTSISVTGKSVKIPVVATVEQKNDIASLILSDTNPPNPFPIDLGQDPSLYDGKYFVSFYATDNETGVDRYEVKEEGFPMIRTGSIYVLQNQNLTGSIEIKAIDLAGNARIQNLNLEEHLPWIRIIISILIVVLLLTAIFKLLIFKKKR